MNDDIVPGLLEEINKSFKLKTGESAKLKKLMAQLKANDVNYIDANEFAIELGNILSGVFGEVITPELLPDGKMYFNIADRVLNETLGNNHKLITEFTTVVQKNLNEKSGLHLKAQVPNLDKDRLDGLVNKLASAEKYEDVQWLLDDPIVNFSQHVVDQSIEKNISFQYSAGLRPTITRKLLGHGCDWCRNLAGTYNYHEEPDEIYHRHERCRCTVEYNPVDRRGIQNSHTKQWRQQTGGDFYKGANNGKLQS